MATRTYEKERFCHQCGKECGGKWYEKENWSGWSYLRYTCYSCHDNPNA